MRIVDQVSRFLVGGLFIFSGLIKLNDPIGTEIKMEEYFEVFAEKFSPFFNALKPAALEISLILIVLEIVLGVAVLIYYRMTITTWILLVLMVFFTFLTGYSAVTNAVTDCGCFGDAIKLTPEQSFYKDLVLMVFVLHLFWHRKRLLPVLYTRESIAIVAITAVVSFALGIYAIQHLPFIDFRAYKIGNHIPQQMIPPEQPRFEYIFLKKDDGSEIRSEKYLTDTLLYKYLNVEQVNVGKTQAKITDFAVSTPDGEDITQQMFEGNKLLIIIYDAQKASRENATDIKALVDGLEGKVEAMILTSSAAPDIDAFRHENQIAAPFFFADATVLKTMIRSNPGITLWKDGTVKGMWHHNDTPTGEEVLDLLPN